MTHVNTIDGQWQPLYLFRCDSVTGQEVVDKVCACVQEALEPGHAPSHLHQLASATVILPACIGG
jgi:hypothetical protein